MCEDAPCCGCCGPQSDNGHEYENEDFHGWPGDGSGEDDFADYNANEADDYANEGEDGACDGPEDFGFDGGMED